MGEGVDVAEGQIRLQQKGYLRRSLDELELDEDLVNIGSEHDALYKNDITDLIGNLGYRVGLEIHHIFVSPWIIYVTVSVDTEVELFSIHNEALIQRRE